MYYLCTKMKSNMNKDSLEHVTCMIGSLSQMNGMPHANAVANLKELLAEMKEDEA